MAKIELIGGHIEIMLIIEMAKIELIGGYIGFMIIIEMAKIESTGGHIEIMLIMSIISINSIWPPFNFYFGHLYKHRDGQNGIYRRPH